MLIPDGKNPKALNSSENEEDNLTSSLKKGLDHNRIVSILDLCYTNAREDTLLGPESTLHTRPSIVPVPPSDRKTRPQ